MGVFLSAPFLSAGDTLSESNFLPQRFLVPAQPYPLSYLLTDVVSGGCEVADVVNQAVRECISAEEGQPIGELRHCAALKVSV